MRTLKEMERAFGRLPPEMQSLLIYAMVVALTGAAFLAGVLVGHLVG